MEKEKPVVGDVVRYAVRHGPETRLVTGVVLSVSSHLHIQTDDILSCVAFSSVVKILKGRERDVYITLREIAI